MSEHLVQFYESGAALADSTAQFLRDGLAAGDIAVVIATPSHRADVERRLLAQGETNPRYVTLDARETLSELLVDGWPSEVRFRDVVGARIREVCRASAGRVRAFGEMVALLAVEGHWQAALRLEELWGALIEDTSVSLLCAYPASAFTEAGSREALEAICARHTHVRPGDGRVPAFLGQGAQRASFVSLVERAIAAVRPMIDERKQMLNVTWPEQDVLVEGDRARLERMFVTLLENAVKFTPLRGRIRVAAAVEGRHAVLRVRDSGAGIVPGVLSIRGLVEMYGGVVEVRSSGLRRGVEFVVRLPIGGPGASPS